MDVIANRVLATYKFKSLDHNLLHETIEELLKPYGVKVIGWVSDKQNIITKCHDTFYADIPHQYCQYHFLNNTWRHLVSFDNNTFKLLKNTVSKVYIHTASINKNVVFKNAGKKSVREVFKSIDDDLQKMIKIQNKRFKSLRGVQAFNELDAYMVKIDAMLKNLNPTYRFTKILSKTSLSLHDALKIVKPNYLKTIELNDYFQRIRKTLGSDEEIDATEIESNLDKIYKEIFLRIIEEDPNMKLKECKSFMPNKNSSNLKTLGEWCRLWKSYRPGLFKYTEFPEKIKTNNGCENAFGKEKQAIFSRVSKGNVGHMLATRGEAYLRTKPCF